MDFIITILPVVTKDLPISPRFTPYDFLSRCKFSTLTTRQPMVEFYLLTFPRFPLQKKEHISYFGKNRTHDFRTSRCASCLLDHSGDEGARQIQSILTPQSMDERCLTQFLALSTTETIMKGLYNSAVKICLKKSFYPLQLNQFTTS